MKNSNFQFLSNNEVTEETQKNTVIKTGSKNYDAILGNGFYFGRKYLIFGANKTGKTQLCHHLCFQAYNHDYKSIYIDTENTFRPERIIELADMRDVNNEKLLKNIFVSKIMSNTALLMKLDEAEEIIKTNKIRVMLIDSINNFYRFEQGNKEYTFYNTRNTYLKILEKIDIITKKYDLITLATAQVTSNFRRESILEVIPVGLQYLNHFFSEFLHLSYKEKDSYYVHLINSHHLPEKKILYRITKRGIEDFKI